MERPSKSKKLVIFGTEDFADIAFEYFTYDSEYEVVGFTIDAEYRKVETKFGLPVVTFEEVDKVFPPSEHEIYAAVVYGKLNRIRRDICNRAKDKKYRLASYISSNAFVWRNVELGEHCFVFEDNTIQPFVKVGDNVIFWSGNHIGHHSVIGSHCFISSHVVISGWNRIGDFSFLGVNSTLANNTTIGEACWLSQGAVVAGEVPDGQIVLANKSEFKPLNEKALFRSLAKASQSRGS